MPLKNVLINQQPTPVEIQAETQRIHESILAGSRYLKRPNFDSFSPGDLESLFDDYDESFFDGQCRSSLGSRPLKFRISRRMTRAGGKTTHVRPRSLKQSEWFEITVSSTLLYQAFHDVDRPITVTGLVCHNRLEALQRIMEHEMTHLAEILVWSSSNCAARRFQSIANGFFSHTEHTHDLITPRERAKVKFGIQTGSRVRFRFDGKHHEGVVNRITKRATVLVQSTKGELFSDGKRYERFYIPVSLLEPLELDD